MSVTKSFEYGKYAVLGLVFWFDLLVAHWVFAFKLFLLTLFNPSFHTNREKLAKKAM